MSSPRRRSLPALLALLLIGAAALLLFMRGATRSSFAETFDTGEGWPVGDGASASAVISGGVYEVTVSAPADIYIGTHEARFGDGVYEITAKQVAGPLDNGYGLIFRADTDAQRFYLFEISGDGYVWIGRCEAQCGNQGWQASDAVQSGLGVANRLRVVVAGPTLTFFVNDRPVGRIDDAATAGDAAGVMVETLGQPGVRVQFDDFQVSPLDSP